MKSTTIERNWFDRFADFITSIKSVILALIFLLIFLMVETQTLFNRTLPGDVWPMFRVIGSFSIAIVFEFTVLIFTANNDHNRERNWFENLFTIPKVLAYFHFVINCYFWQAWSIAEHANGIDTFYRFFLSALFSYLAYIYSSLFVRKYRERKEQIQDLQQKGQLESDNDQLRSQVDELQSAYDQLKSDHGQLKSDHGQLKSDHGQVLVELEAAQAKLSRKKTVKKGLGALLDENQNGK